MTEPVIEASDVVKYLGTGAGRVAALRGVSLSLAGGELVLLMGPSGSGKTTLLTVLGCMLTPTSGTVRLLGQTTSGVRPEKLADLRRRHVGFIFQSYHLFPTLTAVENVRLALEMGGERAWRAHEKAIRRPDNCRPCPQDQRIPQPAQLRRAAAGRDRACDCRKRCRCPR